MTLKDKQRKLQKLLALSASPNKAEAEAAMKKAQILMSAWGIRTIDVDEETHEVGIATECVEGYTKKHRAWESKLAAAISSIFDAEAVIQRRVDGWNIMFIATISERAIVVDLYKRLRRIISKMSKQYAKDNKGNRVMLQKAYAFGMINTIYERLLQIHSEAVEERGLILVKKDAIENKIKEVFGSLGKVSITPPKDRMAYIQGEADGKKVNLNKSLNNGKQQRRVDTTV